MDHRRGQLSQDRASKAGNAGSQRGMAPTLTTERLILRAHTIEDLPACRSLWADPKVVQHIVGGVQDAQQVWFRILRYAGMWSMLGYGNWLLEDRKTGAFLGEAGLLSAERGIPALEGVPEAGWLLAPHAWGKGIATEAMVAILAWSDAHCSAPAVRCIIDPGNIASIRVAGKLGFITVADAEVLGKPVCVLERPRLLSAPQ